MKKLFLFLITMYLVINTFGQYPSELRPSTGNDLTKIGNKRVHINSLEDVLTSIDTEFGKSETQKILLGIENNTINDVLLELMCQNDNTSKFKESIIFRLINLIEGYSLSFIIDGELYVIAKNLFLYKRIELGKWEEIIEIAWVEDDFKNNSFNFTTNRIHEMHNRCINISKKIIEKYNNNEITLDAAQLIEIKEIATTPYTKEFDPNNHNSIKIINKNRVEVLIYIDKFSDNNNKGYVRYDKIIFTRSNGKFESKIIEKYKIK